MMGAVQSNRNYRVAVIAVIAGIGKEVVPGGVRVLETTAKRHGFDLQVDAPLKGRSSEDIDFYVVRENTEGEYSSIGGRIFPDAVFV